VLDGIIREAAVRFRDAIAYDGWDAQLSYADLDRRTDEVAGGFAAAGVGLGDVVVLRLASGADYLIAYGAASKLGAITAGINPKLTGIEQQALIDRVEPAVVVEELPDAAPAPAPLEPDPERPVAIVFTSGTTGTPKGALFRSRQLEAVTRIDLGAIAEEWGEGGPLLASTQFSHIGVMTKLPWYLRTQSCIVALERWHADDVLRAIAHHRIGSIGGVAPQIALLLRSPLLDELDLSCVSSLIVGGAMSPPALVREARERFGAPYSIRYSSTESGGVGLATSFEADDDEALHSVGRPRPGVEVRVGDDGELCLRSTAQFSEYWLDPASTAATIDEHGWVHTGDLATIDDDGLVRISGRMKEMYIRGGYNVAPAEVESVLGDHPAVAQVAVAARPDDVMGEVGVAVVVTRDGAIAPTLDELRAHASGRLAAWKLPEDVLVVDELPLTPMQKLDRAALAQLARLEA
jgi:acyl-CoA synthetase (AMP-forming)/AMP-acid ligase II